LRKLGFSIIGRVLIVAAGLIGAGCSTVIKTSAGEMSLAGPERAILVEAARSAAWAPWPKPSSSSLAQMLAGAEETSVKISRNDAIDAYVAALSGAEDPKAVLLADAGRHLAAADALKRAAEAACESAAPKLSDVALIEESIADLRETRSIYAASLKEISSEKATIEEVKRQFDAALKSLGEAADLLAENAMKKRSDYLAKGAVTAANAGSR